MPLPANLTAAQQTQIQTEGSSLGNTLNDARLANIDGLAQLRSAAGALANPASSREDLIEAGSFLKGYVNGVRAIARQNTSGGGGFVNCVNACETQHSRCLRTSSEFLCDIQAAKCLLSCAVSGSGLSLTGGQPVAPI